MAFRSSGDLTADRRFAYAMSASEDGDHHTAVELVAQALELVPDWPSGWHTLGGLLEKTATPEKARAAYEKALALEPGDELGASLALARLEGRTITMPEAYVAGLFNDYAPRFDAALRGGLGYDAPERLLEALQRVHPQPFARCLDLGCGTGLVAAAFGAYAAAYEGVDLSTGMIREARKRGLYESLTIGDIKTWLQCRGGVKADCAVAADVLVYICDPAPVFAALKRQLAAHACFAFTIQSHAGGGTVLGPDMRYAHAPGEMAVLLAGNGFTVETSFAVSTRLDGGKPVPGHLFVASLPLISPPEPL